MSTRTVAVVSYGSSGSGGYGCGLELESEGKEEELTVEAHEGPANDGSSRHDLKEEAPPPQQTPSPTILCRRRAPRLPGHECRYHDILASRASPNCRYQTEYKVRDYEFLSGPDVKEPVRDYVFLSGPDVNGRVRDYEVLDDIIREEFSRAYKVLKSRTPQIDTETQLDEEEVDRLRGNHARYRIKACLLLEGKRIYPPELILENSYLCRYIKDEPLDWYFDPDLCLLASLSDYQRLVLRNEVSMCINYFQLSNAAGNQFLLLFRFEWVAAIFCFMGIWMHFLFFSARLYASNLQVLGPELLGEMLK
ncbi:uncharacterized protein [Triticum aestivum]|uniref:uncharacterized protein n=1 Tax=Triticum aestivum TaxID=4565 RepID=UPI001D0191FE|nr:uncharacterized protein LOC123067227 [Triticum aestivum]